MGSEWTLLVRRGTRELALQIAVPNPKSRKQPHCSPAPLTYSMMENNIGYLKVSASFQRCSGLTWRGRSIRQCVNSQGATRSFLIFAATLGEVSVF